MAVQVHMQPQYTLRQVQGPPMQQVASGPAVPVPRVNLDHVRMAHANEPTIDGQRIAAGVLATPGRTVVTAGYPVPTEAAAHGVPDTPGRSGSSGTIGAFQATVQGRKGLQTNGVSGGTLPAGAQDPQQCGPLRSARERMPSPEAGSLRLIAGGGHMTGAAIINPMAIAACGSTPVLGRGSFGRGKAAPGMQQMPPLSARTAAPCSAVLENGFRPSASLEGFALGQLRARLQQSHHEKEQELRRQLGEQKEADDLLAHVTEDFQQLMAIVANLRQAVESGTRPETLPGPDRPKLVPKPPFCWQPSQEYEKEFQVTGEYNEIVTKVGDFEDQGWVIPVGGSWRLMRGGLYHWTIRIERKCTSRPQLQLGIHGANHNQPWRLVTTSRCSWSRDDEPWQDRAGGDRLIEEGSYIHLEVDMRGVNSKHGTFAMAINDEPFEQLFDDIPLSQPYSLIPVVSMGGNQSQVRLCPNC